MGQTAHDDTGRTAGTFAPLRVVMYRRIWIASLMSNFGQLILGVGAAWEMTRMASSPGLVALVQTALMLPMMLVALPAGALADMFDRRKIAMTGLAVAITFATALTVLSYLGLTTPWVLLAFCALIGSGVALYGPAWQASIGEHVPPALMPQAIALGSVSYNLARSFGPALGGVIVLAAGAKAAFAINALFYLPLLMVYVFWKRLPLPSRLPPERIDRAIVSGLRYVYHARPIRTVLIRAFLFGTAGATATALAPLIAKNLLGGDASIYGVLLGAAGVGAVLGAVTTGRLAEAVSPERGATLLAGASGIALMLVGYSHSLWLTCACMFVSGGANIMMISLLNISVQTTAPRWVTARALSLFFSGLTGGIAFGAWMWGTLAGQWSVEQAMIASGVMMLLLPLVSFILPLPAAPSQADVEMVVLGNEPDVGMAITLRSGPVVIEIDYDVDPDHAREFYEAMRKVQRTRLRNGGFDWSICRDIADPALWTERYHCPTWGDYLRMRDRYTQSDRDVQEAARAFSASGGLRVRRMLERPFGSVRWKQDTPDLRSEGMTYLGP
ncbi:MFS transporter [Novosphingobium sp. MMS21-SN21R]|uniref:MFS transporter n=1 Tax=Novosphingobium sp. MMS21-SN21R TaxID=2969298 RepID=UPI0028861F6B|nr:MFS transporter [Novosphingobium sp. MMS21-SN21R]MDT0509920.1 MFS transporter [Novosphingobium sp. MMS21-SN21R]